ncbi:hypothetical protein QYM36_002145 [Artemia franciscana]|uniref:Akirin n=2 Tax=Artemia franciscana TaxID=6661 RepID=A0AA88LAZ1_ARTSF|nr:hypothetical protein QYM36_002145 [Artemia franciscana]
MTCATVKRSLDLDDFHNFPRSAKRHKRISAQEQSLLKTSSDFYRTVSRKRTLDFDEQRCVTDAQQLLLRVPSAFDGSVPKMKQDEVMTNVCEEVKRLGRRKQLTYEAVTESGPSNSSIKHEPLLTIKQVITLCEKIIREREEQTRETYDEVLTAKLAEQYAAFVKFTFDQVRQRFETEHPSYLS